MPIKYICDYCGNESIDDNDPGQILRMQNEVNGPIHDYIVCSTHKPKLLKLIEHFFTNSGSAVFNPDVPRKKQELISDIFELLDIKVDPAVYFSTGSTVTMDAFDKIKRRLMELF